MAVAASDRAAQSQSQRLALLEEQLAAVARHAAELELPAAVVLGRLGTLLDDS